MYAYRRLGLAPATVGLKASSPLILFGTSFIFVIRSAILPLRSGYLYSFFYQQLYPLIYPDCSYSLM
jgi:hypothetical protein